MMDDFLKLIRGELPYILTGLDALPADPLLLSGSFNPLHRGHRALLRAAEGVSGRKGLPELSIINVDKQPLDLSEVERRLRLLHGAYSVVLTRAPTFAEKADLLPGAWFALGYDTAVRLLSPAYHDDIPAMLARFRERGTRFVVGGRLHGGVFRGLQQLDVPTGFNDLFVPIPEAQFREDISSTILRGQDAASAD
jgi:hypothetical protein